MFNTNLWECPECGRQWPPGSEQMGSIETLGACLICKKDSLTDKDLQEIQSFLEKFKNEKKLSDDPEDPDPFNKAPAPVTISLLMYRDQCLNNLEGLVDQVLIENQRQLDKWGVQERSAFEWLAFLTEEIGELAQAINDHEYNSDHPAGLKDHVAEESIQVATLALKIAEMFKEAKESTQEINGWVKGG